MIRRYDDISSSITVDLIQTLLLLEKEGKLEVDITYLIGKIISCYALRMTSVPSILLNPLLSFFQSSLSTSDVLVDALQTVATTKSSLIVFEQFLLYIAGNKQYVSYAPPFLDWYLRMPQYSEKFIEKLLVGPLFLFKPVTPLLKVLLRSDAIHKNPRLTHHVLNFIVTVLKTNGNISHVMDLVTQVSASQGLAVDSYTWFLLCCVGFASMSRTEFIIEKTGCFLHSMVKLLIRNHIVCDEQIHRCLRCVLSRCCENAMRDLLSVETVHTSLEGGGIIAQCIKHLDDIEYSSVMIQSTETPPEFFTVYIFSNQSSIVQLILSTSLFTHHSLISIFLYVFLLSFD